MAYPLLDDVGRRLVGALQVDGRAIAQTVLRIHAEAHQWRLPGLSKQEREAVGNLVRSHGLVPPVADETEARIRAILEADGRAGQAGA